MHHLLVTIGSHGDTHPFVGLGARLRERGHRVTVAANGAFRQMIERAGLEFEELGTAEEYWGALRNPDIWHPVKGFKTVFESGILPAVRRAYELVRRHAEAGEVVVTAHAIAFGARIAQEKLGVPLATVHLAPAVFRSGEEPPVFKGSEFMQYTPAWLNRLLFKYVMDKCVADPVLAGPVNELRGELGLAPVARIVDEWWNSPELVVGLFPEWYGPMATGWPKQLRLTGFPLFDERGDHELAAETEAFLQSGAPPIAFTFGSAMTHAGDYLMASADACERLGRRGLLLTKYREQVPRSLPAGVMHVEYAPFSELLPRCAALVHHGGVGTTAQALAAGVPQLIVPFAHDQPDNAARVKRLGCGAEIGPKAYRKGKGAGLLETLLDKPVVAATCREVAAKFSGHDPLGEACDLIEGLSPRAAGARPSGDRLCKQAKA